MKFPSKVLVVLTSTFGLFSINFAVSLPAQASVTCEGGTISNYSNGSLASCILGQDTTVQVSSPSSGSSNFYCQAQKFISFNEKAQFTGCQLSQEIQLRKGNSIETCPAEYEVNVSVESNGTQSITCNP
ncbi:hypothetical protein H6G26_28245 [Nostoc sp. FACHB-888]|nr:hypothetical protein [Nostoc sp. FACHB-888]